MTFTTNFITKTYFSNLLNFLYKVERGNRKMFVISPENNGLENVMAYAELSTDESCPNDNDLSFKIYTNGVFEPSQNFEIEDCTCKNGFKMEQVNEVFSKTATQAHVYKGDEKLSIYSGWWKTLMD